MKRVFIGHRGVGKTELLKRHQIYFADIEHFDLDTEIEKQKNQTVSDIFNSEGELAFRKLEQKVFADLIKKNSFVIALGAGFDISSLTVDTLSSGIEVIYVSRRTDLDGRIFLNRPALDPKLSLLDEYQQRYQKREKNFRDRADFIYHMPEGLIETDDIEKSILTGSFVTAKAFVTSTKAITLPHVKNIELRTDIFTDGEIKKITLSRDHNFLVSYRKKTTVFNFKSGLIDWALELGAVPSELNSADLIVSNHDDEIQSAIHKFKSYEQFHQKLCPIINTWEELIFGHKWQSEKPEFRSFLPRSNPVEKRSKWRWYRELQFNKQKVNFVQGSQDFDDQPSLYEYIKASLYSKNNFAAVLGSPVHHSKSPMTQYKKLNQNFIAIPLNEADFPQALSFLHILGLNCAAVTSPLKNTAGKYCKKTSAVNSLALKNNIWMSASTDEAGLIKLFENIKEAQKNSVVVWGGGGVLKSIQDALPTAKFYSAQSQSPRTKNDFCKNPKIIVWSAPRKIDVQFPPNIWKPELVIDLNYSENSMGIEYAKNKNLKYISGDALFYAQAEKQLQFFKENLGF